MEVYAGNVPADVDGCFMEFAVWSISSRWLADDLLGQAKIEDAKKGMVAKMQNPPLTLGDATRTYGITPRTFTYYYGQIVNAHNEVWMEALVGPHDFPFKRCRL